MTDVIIVHSMHGNSRNHWYQWLEHNLTLEGYDVTLFNFESLKRRQWISGLKLWRNKLMYAKGYIFCNTWFRFNHSFKIYWNDWSADWRLFSIAGFKEDAENIDLDIDLSNVTIDYDNIKKESWQFYGLSSKMTNTFHIKKPSV